MPDFPLSYFSKDRGDSTLFQLQCLASEHRLFRDLAINPAVRVLLDHMFGKDMGGSATRLSSNNAFIKLQSTGGKRALPSVRGSRRARYRPPTR